MAIFDKFKKIFGVFDKDKQRLLKFLKDKHKASLSSEDLTELIENDPLIFSLGRNKTNSLNLSTEQWDYLIKNSDLSRSDRYNSTALRYFFSYGLEENVNLTEEQIAYLIKNSDLNIENKEDKTTILLEYLNKDNNKIKLSNENIFYLIKNTNLNKQDINNWCPLFSVLAYHKDNLLNLSTDHIDYLIKNTNLKLSINGYSALSIAFLYNKQSYSLTAEQLDYLLKNSDLNTEKPSLKIFLENFQTNDLNKEQLNYLIQNSDLSILDNNGVPLLFTVIENKDKLNLTEQECIDLVENKRKDGNTFLLKFLLSEIKVNLSEKQWDYLLKNSDLKQLLAYENSSPLAMALEMYQKRNLSLTENQWKYFIDNSDLSLLDYEGVPLFLKLSTISPQFNFEFSEEQWQNIVKNFKFYTVDSNGNTSLFNILSKNDNLHLNPKQLDYILKTVDLNKTIDKENNSALFIALKYSSSLNLGDSTWRYLIENTNFSLDKSNNILAAAFHAKNHNSLNLTSSKWSVLLKNSNPNLMINDEFPLIIALNQKLELSSDTWDYLIKNTNLDKLSQNNKFPIIEAIDIGANLSSETWDYLIKKTDFEKLKNNNLNVLAIALKSKSNGSLKLNNEQWDCLLKNSDLTGASGQWNLLMHVIRKSNNKGFIPTTEQWDYLLNNSDIKSTKSSIQLNAFILAFGYDKILGLNLKLNSEQWDYLIKNTDLNVYEKNPTKTKNDNDPITVTVKEIDEIDKIQLSPLLIALRSDSLLPTILSKIQVDYILDNTSEEVFKAKNQYSNLDPLRSYLLKDFLGRTLTIDQWDKFLQKSNTQDSDWIPLYFKNKITQNIPTTDFTLIKIFEDSVKDPQILTTTLNSFIKNNIRCDFNLDKNHFDFLVKKIDFTHNNKISTNSIVESYISFQKEQKIDMSESSLTILISNTTYDKELFSKIIENKDSLNLKDNQLNILKSKEKIYYDGLKLNLEDVLIVIIDKINGSSYFDLKKYEHEQYFFQSEFKRVISTVVFSSTEINKDIFLIKNTYNNLTDSEKIKFKSIIDLVTPGFIEKIESLNFSLFNPKFSTYDKEGVIERIKNIKKDKEYIKDISNKKEI